MSSRTYLVTRAIVRFIVLGGFFLSWFLVPAAIVQLLLGAEK